MRADHCLIGLGLAAHDRGNIFGRDGSRAMIELDVTVPVGLQPAFIEQAVARTCREADLRRTFTGTLAKYPGCIHWHFTHPPQRGTLELTWWPTRQRLWFKVGASRSQPWITALLPELHAGLTSVLAAAKPLAARASRLTQPER